MAALHSVCAQVMETQRRWAVDRGVDLSPSGAAFASTADALFSGELRDDTRKELKAGKGGELAKLPSLRSSSCLVVNVFEPWREDPGGANDLARMTGLSASTIRKILKGRNPSSRTWAVLWQAS